MKFGFIGAGKVAQTIASHLVGHGHEVVFSNRRGPESLGELVESFGPKARAGTVQDAASQDIVVLAVRWGQAKQALAEVADWNGRILVDTTNHFITINPLTVEDTGGKTASEVIAGYAPGARVVKAFNTIVMNWIQDVSPEKPRTVVFLSGDDAEAKRKLAGALEVSGLVPVDLGGLVEGGKLQQPGGPLVGLHLDLLKRL